MFEDTSIQTHDDMVATQAEAARTAIPDEDRADAVAHIFAQGGELADSECPLAVGGAETVHTSRFEGFDYVALGHLHRRQQFGAEQVQYAGSLMKYSFDEVHHEKSVHLVEMDAKGHCEMERLSLTPERDLRRVEGTLSEIQEGPSPGENERDYVRVTLQDEGLSDGHREVLEEAFERLREEERAARSPF